MTSSFPMADTSGMAPASALAESRRFLKSTLDALSAHIAILDEHGTIIEVNAAWIRFARENDFNGGQHGLGDNYLKICEAAVGDFSAEALAMAKGIRAVMAGESNEFYLEYPCHSPQQQRWFIGRATRFAGAGPVRVVVAHEDITRCNHAEDALRWKTGFLEAQVNTLIDGILVTDRQGRQILQNRQVSSLFKIPPHIAADDDDAKQVGLAATRTKNPEQFAEKVAFLYAHPGEASRDEIELKDGTTLDRYTSPVIGSEGTYYGRLWTFRDNTKGKQAELQLRKLSHAVEQSPVSIVITDLLGGIEYVNPKFCALTGYSFEEVRGKNPRILKSGSMPNESYRQMWATITSGEEWHGEFHNRKKNGELYWELASISPIRDDKGNVTHFVAMKEDITERKRMEVSLRESEERYRALFDRSLDCVYVNDFEGRFLAGNPAAFALLGYGREELASLSFSSFLMPEHLSRAFRMAEQLRTGGTQTTPIEYTLRRKDGSFVEIETNASLIMRDGQPHSILGIARDITERKRVEDGLKEQLAMRERLAKIAANVPGIIYSFRLRPDGSACIPYASPTIEAFCEVRAEDLVEDATPLFKIIHPDDHGRVWESIMESARTMSPWRVEFRVRHPQRGLLWIEGQSTPERSADGSILWHGFMSEISERKQAEKTLREKEHLLSESQRLGHIGSWFADLTGPLSWSEEMYRIFGVSPDAFIPTAESLLGLIHPDNQPAMQAWLAGCAVGAKPVEMEFCITRPDGMIRFIKGNSEAVYDVNHRLIHIAGTAQDITESKQAQVEREGLERMVAEHQANEESVRQALLHEQKSSQIKSRFVSMVSHEFRTPLSVINLAVELLKGYWERMTPAERSEQLKEIQGAIARMTQMMTDFLVQGDCTSGTMECQPARVAVEELCRRLIAEVPSYANSPRTIELVVAPPIGEAFLDENILRHILGNLLSNAVKYSSAGQPVKLEVQRIVGTTQSNGGTDAFPEPYLEFKVSDSGIGIPATDLPKLYQAFHRATNVGNRPGTGIGLTIVKQFVDLHRGTIRFESQEGKGTTVWVHLPIAPPASRTES